ncbi:uncharacterized protein IL334_006760 [Kwoniella shivajii]|uniref:ASX DEUBAD domain-containing protein n=1 Tax=Kwoniella shivajii TaxID=564305 RepID=A0ABZ1D8Z8_9TREE|nr:hypothetical protein IL334_006760 [Kwoniella shivajii]
MHHVQKEEIADENAITEEFKDLEYLLSDEVLDPPELPWKYDIQDLNWGSPNDANTRFSTVPPDIQDSTRANPVDQLPADSSEVHYTTSNHTYSHVDQRDVAPSVGTGLSGGLPLASSENDGYSIDTVRYASLRDNQQQNTLKRPIDTVENYTAPMHSMSIPPNKRRLSQSFNDLDPPDPEILQNSENRGSARIVAGFSQRPFERKIANTLLFGKPKTTVGILKCIDQDTGLFTRSRIDDVTIPQDSNNASVTSLAGLEDGLLCWSSELNSIIPQETFVDQFGERLPWRSTLKYTEIKLENQGEGDVRTALWKKFNDDHKGRRTYSGLWKFFLNKDRYTSIVPCSAEIETSE